jgi:hypothetical protein
MKLLSFLHDSSKMQETFLRDRLQNQTPIL